MQEEPPTAGKPAGYSAVFTDAHWWFFCFLILGFNFLLLAFDHLPKLFMGDSAVYLWTAFSGLPPPDRSFFLRVRHSLVIALDEEPDTSTDSSGFSRRRNCDFSCTCLPMDFRTCLSRVLSFWTFMFARSIAISVAALCYDRND